MSAPTPARACPRPELHIEGECLHCAVRDLADENERLRFLMECANTPLMRDVMAERDALREQRDQMRDALEAIHAQVSGWLPSASSMGIESIARHALSVTEETQP